MYKDKMKEQLMVQGWTSKYLDEYLVDALINDFNLDSSAINHLNLLVFTKEGTVN